MKPIPTALALLVLASAAFAEDPIRLQETLRPGTHYHVSSRVQLGGTLSVPPEKDKPAPKPLPVTGESAIDYDERVLDVGTDGVVKKTARAYRRVELHRKIDDRTQESTIRAGVRRLVLLRLETSEVPFSPDGPLLWGEIDFVRTDVFTPALTGLLPDKAVRPGDRWVASTAAVKELTDLEGIDQGDLECKLDEVGSINNRRQARVTVVGTVKGTNEDGPNRQRLEGFYYFDLESNHIGYLYLKGTHMLLDKDGKEQGRIDGRFTLTRTRTETARDLTDEGLKGVVLEPNADNTRLLYDNPDLGVRFLHPRRWRVTAVRGLQVAIDGPENSGLLLTLETLKNVPTAAEFLRESEAYLKKQGGKVVRTEQQRQVGTAPGVDQFAIEVEMGGQKAVMDYYVIRQKAGGATIAARLPASSTAAMRKDVEEIARSVSVLKEPGGK